MLKMGHPGRLARGEKNAIRLAANHAARAAIYCTERDVCFEHPNRLRLSDIVNALELGMSATLCIEHHRPWLPDLFRRYTRRYRDCLVTQRLEERCHASAAQPGPNSASPSPTGG